MNDISFGIKKWQACTSYFDQLPDQHIDVPNGALHIAQDLSLQPSSIKPMLRRRLSPLGKFTLWCADQVLATEDGDERARRSSMPCVFASQHGEVGRTTDILDLYAQEQGVSPTAFSLSVHNAIAGIYSIANGLKGNILATAAGDLTLPMGLLEAASLLKSDVYDEVLCVIYDQNIPDKLKTGPVAPDFDFAIALLLDKTSPLQLRFSSTDDKNDSKEQEHPFLPFTRLLLSSTTEIQVLNFRHWRVEKHLG
ncbi:hypothetical protein TDB9533_04240 [Thalassocella blandensis]|nr:hypothetical protein TDB9533_04240 [Thalassocella blandensis]